MNRIATSAAALALLMTSVAFAQTTPDGTSPSAEQTAPETNTVAPAMRATDSGGEDAGEVGEMSSPEAHGEGGDDSQGAYEGRRRGAEGDRGRRGMRHHPGWRMHHPGAMRGGRQGAAFRFSRGDDGPSIMIRCAARDTTQECVQAIMPMLDTLLQQRAGAAPAQ